MNQTASHPFVTRKREKLQHKERVYRRFPKEKKGIIGNWEDAVGMLIAGRRRSCSFLLHSLLSPLFFPFPGRICFPKTFNFVFFLLSQHHLCFKVERREKRAKQVTDTFSSWYLKVRRRQIVLAWLQREKLMFAAAAALLLCPRAAITRHPNLI